MSFANGSSAQTVSISIVDDAVVETTEDFSIELSAPTGGATLGALASMQMVILNDDFGPGDLTGDNRVNADDLAVVLAHFGQTTTSAGWDPKADTNGSGSINADDFLPVLSNFGKTYP